MHIRVHNISQTKDFRRRLRQKQTRAEKILWRALRNRKLDGEKFTRQHGIGFYVADFHCSKHRLVIEVDGDIHLRPDIAERDQRRTEFIEGWDITVIRFWNEEVIENLPRVLNEIRKHFKGHGVSAGRGGYLTP